MGALAHALIGSTMAVNAVASKGIKAAAGPPAPDSYSTDASGKVTPNYRPDNTRSRLERLAQAYGTLADLDHCDLMER